MYTEAKALEIIELRAKRHALLWEGVDGNPTNKDWNDTRKRLDLVCSKLFALTGNPIYQTTKGSMKNFD